MNSSDKDSTKPWATDIGLRIDEICDEFELSYQRNEQPRIEDYLDETIGHVETQLAEMVMIELAYRRKAGEEPTVHEYVSRFPSYEKVVEELSDYFEVAIPGNFKTPPLVDNLESFEFLGSGSFGCVWKAWDAKLRRFVAVKTPIQLVPTQSDRDLIQREARVVARAKHPYVVPVYATGEVKGRVYVVYEFVPGTTLKDYLRKNKLTPQQAAILCSKIAEAVHHVHELGIVHRDLKPANILIDPLLDPHVMDFGLAKLLDASATIAQPDEPLGTPAYMSPEQVRGKSAEMDLRSDIYSLGVILYELLSGSTLFDGGANEVMRKVLVDEPAALAKVVPGVDRNLALICHRCLEKEREDRYRTAAELAEDLRRYIAGQKVVARPVSYRLRAWRWLKKLKSLAAFVGLMSVCLIASLAAVAGGMLGTTPPPKIEEKWRVLVTTDPPGAHVRVIPRDERTGQLNFTRVQSTPLLTPVTLDLTPAKYCVEVFIPGEEDRTHEVVRTRSHQVTRTVPEVGTTMPAGPGRFREFYDVNVDEKSLRWPEILIPELDIYDRMVYVEGTPAFPIGDYGQTVAIEPFYVSPREFTFGDFLKIRPGQLGNVRDKPATEQPPENTMAEWWENAEHWAEESGGRLLTEVEFEYLAVMAAKAERENPQGTNDEAEFEVAGGSMRDAIPGTEPIRGILSGYAEWTSSLPNQTGIWRPLTLAVATDYRIVRGGTPATRPNEFRREPHQRTAVPHFDLFPHVGFRVARSVNFHSQD